MFFAGYLTEFSFPEGLSLLCLLSPGAMTRRTAARALEASSASEASAPQAVLDIEMEQIRVPTPDFEARNDGGGGKTIFKRFSLQITTNAKRILFH